MASTFAVFLLRCIFFMAAKVLALFPAQLSIEKQVQAEKPFQEKRKIKNATASQKLNLATAQLQEIGGSVFLNYGISDSIAS
jgi:hypothetical protein